MSHIYSDSRGTGFLRQPTSKLNPKKGGLGKVGRGNKVGGSVSSLTTSAELMTYLVGKGKLAGFFNLGDYDAGGALNYAKNLVTNTYPDGMSGTPPVAAVTYDSVTNWSTSATGNPSNTRGYVESTSSTANDVPLNVAFKGTGDYNLKDNMWFAFNYWPTNPQQANSGIHSIMSFREYFASGFNNFPFSVHHASGDLTVYVLMDGGGNFVSEYQYTHGTPLVLGQWNHMIVQWGAINEPLSIWVNGVKASWTRPITWAMPNPQMVNMMFLASKGTGGGVGQHRAKGRLSDLWIGKHTNGATSLLTDAEATALYSLRGT